MLYVLLQKGFDLLFVAQTALHCERERIEMKTVGLVNRPIPANTHIRVQPDMALNGLTVTNLLIVDSSAETQLLTEPRIHRLATQALEKGRLFATPMAAKTLARLGLFGVQVVTDVQEISIEDMDEAGTIVSAL